MLDILAVIVGLCGGASGVGALVWYVVDWRSKKPVEKGNTRHSLQSPANRPKTAVIGGLLTLIIT